MLPLVGLALNFLPDLVKVIAGDKTGRVADKVTQAVTDIAGTSDPATALAKLGVDTAAAAALRQKLAEIAVEELKVQNAEQDQQRADLLAAVREANANTQGARSLLGQLASAKSPIAYAPPIVSAVVTIGFFFIISQIIYSGIPVPPGKQSADVNTVNILNIVIGVLGTSFATVVNFWLGSSSGSRSKDAQVLQLQQQNTTQTNQMLQTIETVQTNHAEQTKAAIQAIKEVATTPAPAAPTVASAPVVPEPDNFDGCVAVTLAQEGGFTEQEADPGGATNFGITRAALAAWRGHDVSVNDVRDLSRGEAIEIYRANYWNPARCSDLPAGIDLMVFDFGVNAGPRTAVKLLQRCIGITSDGSVGPNTIRVAGAADAKDVIHRMAEGRLDYYHQLENWATFGNGWTKRTNQVASSALLMVT